MIANSLCSGMLLLAVSGDHAAELKERFFREAPTQWAAYERQALLIKATSRLQSQGLSFEDTFTANTSCRMLLRRQLDRSESSLYAVNPDYSFELRRHRDQDAWSLFDVELANAQRESPGRAVMTARENNWPQSLLIRIYDERLSELVRMPQFTIQSIEPDDSGLVRLEFQCPHETGDDPTKMYAVQFGSLVLDPNRYWHMREGQAHASTRQSTVVAVIRSIRSTIDERSALPLPIHYETNEE